MSEENTNKSGKGKGIIGFVLSLVSLLLGGWLMGALWLSTKGSAGAAGIQTAAVIFGGYNNGLPPGNVTNATEEYNGSSWTSGGTGSTARQSLGSAGTQTAGLAFGGLTSAPTANLTATEEYDGTSWTGGGALSAGRSAFLGSFGTQTAAAAASGSSRRCAGPSHAPHRRRGSGQAWPPRVGDRRTAGHPGRHRKGRHQKAR